MSERQQMRTRVRPPGFDGNQRESAWSRGSVLFDRGHISVRGVKNPNARTMEFRKTYGRSRSSSLDRGRDGRYRDCSAGFRRGLDTDDR
jgi:hypothetical protein